MRYLFPCIIFISLVSNLSRAQDLKITKYEGYDCRIDSTWSGGCENKYIYQFSESPNKKKLKQIDYRAIKIRGNWSKDGFTVIDSSNFYKKTSTFKIHNNIVFTKMLGHILKNGNNKIIGLNVDYFIDKEQKYDANTIEDSMSFIRKEITDKMSEYLVSSVIKKGIVEINYNSELYTFIKTEGNLFWSAYNSQSDGLLFRFFYPDWNIYINNLLNTKKKYRNDLQIIKINNEVEYDIGRKILTPIRRNKK